MALLVLSGHYCEEFTSSFHLSARPPMTAKLRAILGFQWFSWLQDCPCLSFIASPDYFRFSQNPTNFRTPNKTKSNYISLLLSLYGTGLSENLEMWWKNGQTRVVWVQKYKRQHVHDFQRLFPFRAASQHYSEVLCEAHFKACTELSGYAHGFAWIPSGGHGMVLVIWLKFYSIMV